MPLYEYECAKCGHRFEQIQKFSDPAVEECPSCGAHAVRKLLSSPAIQFKGSGWYVTDYARKEARKTEGREKAETGDTSTTGEGKESGDAAAPSASSKEATSTSPHRAGTGSASASASSSASSKGEKADKSSDREGAKRGSSTKTPSDTTSKE